jgi:hypothetical protein
MADRSGTRVKRSIRAVAVCSSYTSCAERLGARRGLGPVDWCCFPGTFSFASGQCSHVQSTGVCVLRGCLCLQCAA